MTFTQKVSEAVKESNSCLCVGLDPDLRRIPQQIKDEWPDANEQVLYFLKEVIDVTSAHCAAYKPNLGFFEALGEKGLEVFQEIIKYIPEHKIIIADAKRGDISSTAEHYASAYFEMFDVDAITLNPLMGFETLKPFMHYPDKGIFTLTLTSNPGAADFLMKPFDGHDTMAAYIAQKLAAKNEKHATHLGMVIGATQAGQLEKIINHHPKAGLLIPGIGTQGGSVEALTKALKNHTGIPLVNSSRSILYAGQHAKLWQETVKEKATELKKALQPITNQYV